MQTSEYQNIFKNEENHFFYTIIHKLVLIFISKYSIKSRSLKILDAGCGTGLLAKKMEIYGNVYAVDLNQEALIFSKKRNLKYLKKASISRLPFIDNFFDVITCIDVLYHKNVDDQKALQEFKRVLKPQGILIIKVPAFDWLRGNHDIIVETKKRYKKQEIEILLRDANFNIIRISYFFAIIFPFIFTKRLMDKFNKNITSEVGSLPFLLNKLFFFLTNFELAILSKYNLPFGVSVISVAKKIN